MNSITYIGLDVHKTTIAVAVAEGGRSGEARQLGTFPNRADVLRKMVERGGQLSFCYDAGPCGYGLHRFLRGLGHACAVVAPSLIPIKSGDRIKTNRRDAVTLARLHRAGELTEVWVPDAAHEAMRDASGRKRLRDIDGLSVVLPVLENGAFRWPPISDGVMRLTASQLAALVDGMDWSRLHACDVARPTATS